MKKCLSLLLSLLLLLALLPAFPAMAETEGDWDYTVADGAATVTGYHGPGGDVAVPSTLGGYPVTTIGNKAFFYQERLISLSVPDSVTVIAREAFSDCSKLQEVKLSNALTEIGIQLFSFCRSLTSITIPEGVTKINSQAFYHCSSLTDVKLPQRLEEISFGAFEGCGALTGLTIPEGVTILRLNGCTALTEVNIPESVTDFYFQNCKALEKITVPGSVGTVPIMAFQNCKSLVDVTLQPGLTSISNYAFQGCTALRRIVIPEGVTKIGSQAFAGCGALTEAVLPKSATEIAEDAFAGCALENPALQADDTQFWKWTVSGDGAVVTKYSGFDRAVAIPSVLDGHPVTAIGNEAFENNQYLTSVVIPEGVTSIGDCAFEACTLLANVALPRTLTHIGRLAFSGCALTDVVIPDSVTELSPAAFSSCKQLKSVTLPQGLRSIDGVFSGCVSLTGLSIPAAVTYIGKNAFSGCTSLSALTVPEAVTYIGENAFSGCTALARVTLPARASYLGNNAFENCAALTEITLPQGIRFVGDHAFYKCAALQKAVIPQGVRFIGEWAFYECQSLTQVTLPDGLVSIGRLAFDGCASLAKLTIPDSVTYIGDSAFAGCGALSDVSYGGNPSYVGATVFSGCDESLSLPLPAKDCAAVPAAEIVTYAVFRRSGNNQIQTQLFAADGKLCRLEPVAGRLRLETYTEDFRLLSARWLESDPASVWGGFYEGKDAYFLITGKRNYKEDEGCPVVTVTKYDKSWNRLGAASLYGANTTYPFDSGSVRCAEYGGMLYVHTCHQMYVDGAGLRHQANMTFCLRESDMKITQSRYEVTAGWGYVSHSFNQFILIDSDRRIVTLDHGDAYPRAAVLQRYRIPAGGEIFTDDEGMGTVWDENTTRIRIQNFPGATGDNTTGAGLGGLAETATGYVTVYHYNGVGANSVGEVMGVATDDPEPVRNVFLSWTDKNDFSEEGTHVTKLTDYPSGGSYSADTPFLVPLGAGGGWVIWAEKDVSKWNRPATGKLFYARYAADGSVGEVCCAEGALSDCPPIVVDGKVIWYVTGGTGLLTFYVLDDSGLSVHPAVFEKPGKIPVRLNGEYVQWTDAEPFIDENSRTLVPLRAVAEALGLTVTWNSEYRYASFTDGSRTISFPIGKNVAYTTEGDLELDTAAVIVNRRTYAPIRYLAEYFGCKVGWEAETKTVTIVG